MHSLIKNRDNFYRAAAAVYRSVAVILAIVGLISYFTSEDDPGNLTNWLLAAIVCLLISISYQLRRFFIRIPPSPESPQGRTLFTYHH